MKAKEAHPMWNLFRLCLVIPFLSVLPMLAVIIHTEVSPRPAPLSEVSLDHMEGAISELSYAPLAHRVAYRLDWSPMGQGLWVCALDQGHHDHVAFDSTEERYDVLALSPDGGYLACARSTHDSPPRRLGVTIAEVGTAKRADFDGTSVAWTKKGDRCAIADPAAGTITVIDVPSFKVRLVARTPRAGSPYGQSSMAWSPDGVKLAYVIREETITMSSLWVLSLSGAEPRLVTSDGEGCVSLLPFWSSDGRLAFRLTSADDPAGSRHYVQEADGNLREIGRGAMLDPAGGPAWSPDGASIVFSRTVLSGKEGGGSSTDVWAMDVESGALRRLTSDGEAFGEVFWSADGRLYLQESSRLRYMGPEKP